MGRGKGDGRVRRLWKGNWGSGRGRLESVRDGKGSRVKGEAELRGKGCVREGLVWVRGESIRNGAT